MALAPSRCHCLPNLCPPNQRPGINLARPETYRRPPANIGAGPQPAARRQQRQCRRDGSPESLRLQLRTVRVRKHLRLEERMETPCHIPTPQARFLPLRRGQVRRPRTPHPSPTQPQSLSLPGYTSGTSFLDSTARPAERLQPQRPVHATPTAHARALAAVRAPAHPNRDRACEFRGEPRRSAPTLLARTPATAPTKSLRVLSGGLLRGRELGRSHGTCRAPLRARRSPCSR